jgi:hypothetical protein
MAYTVRNRGGQRRSWTSHFWRKRCRALITGKEHYFPVPLVLSPSCKTEPGTDLIKWILLLVKAYHEQPEGEKKHGPIYTIGTDGEASFRFMRFLIGLREELDRASDLGRILYELPGLNCFVSLNGLL